MGAARENSTNPPYTKKQGQYLAFIHYYTKIHDQPPAEHEMQRYFRTTPPTVHNMVKTLHARGLIERTPGQARTIRVLLSRDQIPDLE
jgi:repressor LexA